MAPAKSNRFPHDARGLRSACGRVVSQHDKRQHERDGEEGEPPEKDCRPAEGVDQQSATEAGGDAADRLRAAHQAQRPPALSGGESETDERRPHREHRGTGDPLQHPQRNERVQIGRETEQQHGNGIDQKAKAEEPREAKPVARTAHGDAQRGAGRDERDDHPLQRRDIRIEGIGDRRKRDVHGRVEGGSKEAECDTGGDPPSAGAVHALVYCAGCQRPVLARAARI